MPTLLQLDSSADLTTSRSRALTATFADAWTALGEDHVVVHRDLHREPLPHLADADLHFPKALRPAGSHVDPAAESLQAGVIAELLAADVVVIGVPLYNYSMPSTLKAWVDHIHVPTVTAPFGDDPTQPMKGKTVVLMSTRGGAYDAGTPSEYDDHAIPALSIVLGAALGMTVETIVATRTLTERFGGPSGEVEKQDSELAAGHQQAVAAAKRLG
ncbi:FMN-dependent NADH-azoreductase [Frondihabitans sp. VKM Ac-2883]|uniref:FMN-dependent NADH-azoreductase n=1 Tax=Frondihabitans sp. VKM Ac-2883 TaxID=2783823 RepID=UPI00188A34FB|nr:NAD(P)H-dependent oxidoreductase [Frondihabitans sp. VKM Ac-2883]MBF4574997.1 NAD(P)H-dependent oxidoreductase [Frondihabitans sp. VKM Ac-2883]